HLDEFLQAARRESRTTAAVPLPVVLDADYKAVNQLDIRGNQAKPSTYILDKEGNVRFAYVGAYDADRPSVKAILDQLDAIQGEQPPAGPAAGPPADGTAGTYLMIDADPEPGMTDARDVPPEGLPALMKGERVVLDSLSTIIARNGIDAALSLLSRAKRDVAERKANALFILYSDLHPVAEEIRIMRAADVIIELKEIIIMNEIERQLAVHKVRNAQVPKRLIPYNITEKGIELSTTSRVI
ncbi:MAG: ATPase domain-containing protein, partial [Methanolinea sp.]